MFTRIPAPKYKIGKFVLNEYELRQLQLEIALGLKSGPYRVTDSMGKSANLIENSGLLDDRLHGLSLADDIAMKTLHAHFDQARSETTPFNSRILKNNTCVS